MENLRFLEKEDTWDPQESLLPSPSKVRHLELVFGGGRGCKIPLYPNKV